MNVFQKGLEADRKTREKEAKESRNRARAGAQVLRLREAYKIKYQLTAKEADDLIRAEQPGLWFAYQNGTDLPKSDESSSRIY